MDRAALLLHYCRAAAIVVSCLKSDYKLFAVALCCIRYDRTSLSGNVHLVVKLAEPLFISHQVY